jgi:hypothetical protein
MTEGYVYAISSGDFVKIGWAADPVRRLSELNVGSPHIHELIGFARGTKDHERQMHEICSEQRVRGEWFRREGDVETFLSLLPKRDRLEKDEKFRRPADDNVIALPNTVEVSCLFLIIHEYASATGLSDTTISSRAFGDSKRIRALREGAGITISRFNNIIRWFSANWPINAVWPDGVVRPLAPIEATP